MHKDTKKKPYSNKKHKEHEALAKEKKELHLYAIRKIGWEVLLNNGVESIPSIIFNLVETNIDFGRGWVWKVGDQEGNTFDMPVYKSKRLHFRQLTTEELLTHGHKRVRALGHKRSKRN